MNITQLTAVVLVAGASGALSFFLCAWFAGTRPSVEPSSLFVGWAVVGIAAASVFFLGVRARYYRLRALHDQLSEILCTRAFSRRIRDVSRRRGGVSSERDLVALLAADINSLLQALDEASSRVEKAMSAAERADRSKSSFIAKVSHELRTPISGILGMLRILLRQEESDGKRSYISMARDSAYGLLSTINEILDFSKAEAHKLSLETIEFKLRTVVVEALRTVAPRFEEKGTIELLYDVSSDLPDLYVGDPLRMKQYLVNLLGNAVKFTERGSVTLQVTARAKRDSTVEILFQVADTGVGIPADRLEQIFDPFTQADDSVTRVYSGTGLGLTIVRQIVEAMKGDISVTSRVGTGTTFSVTVPLICTEVTQPISTCPIARGGRVGIVDRDSYFARFTIEKLARYGLVGEVVDTHSRLNTASLQDSLKDFELLIVTGDAVTSATTFDVLSKAAFQRKIPIVVILSPFQIAVRERMLSLGIPYIVTRPISVEDILLTVSGVVNTEVSRWEDDEQAALSQVRQLHILVADDAVTNRIILTTMLGEAGHQVTCLENGLDLFHTVERFISGDCTNDHFDMILTDIQMPLMDGVTATKKIRELEKKSGRALHIPIFAVTAHAMREEAEEMKAAGIDGVITKPIEPSCLADALRQVAAQADSASEPESASRTGALSLYEDVDALTLLIEQIWRQMELEGDVAESECSEACSVRVEQILDIRDIYSRAGDSTRRAQLFLRAFAGSFTDQLTQLTASCSSDDCNTLRLAAHALKGLLLEIGAKKASSVARDLEVLCKQGELEQAQQLVVPLSRHVMLVARLIERALQALSRSPNENVQTMH